MEFITRRNRTSPICIPVSSRTSRAAHAWIDSPCSRWPPGYAYSPAPCEPLRLPSNSLPSRITSTPMPTRGRSSLMQRSLPARERGDPRGDLEIDRGGGRVGDDGQVDGDLAGAAGEGID